MESEKFSSRLGFILVSAGCAIGLGNVWKFPYICGQNGGAAFILIYLACLALLGLPIIICEFAVGRGSGASLMKAYDILEKKGSRFSDSKWICFIGNYMLMMFYTMVAGWMMYYVYLHISGVFVSSTAADVKNVFDGMLGKPGNLIFWTLIAIFLAFGVCALGLQNGVEKITKYMMLFLLILMAFLAIRSVSLAGASEGIKFYLIPDFNKLVEHGVGNVVFDAMTHAFFTLSVGMGSMEIFGSYLDKNRKITGEALNVTLLDTFVALVAGLIIIPSCFAYGVEPGVGPSLLFVTLPNVFNHMPLGRFWGTLFFVFMSFAALSTVIAVFENIIKMTMDASNCSRKKSVLINLIGISVLSLPAILGFNVLSAVQPIGPGSTIMDLEDFIVSYNILPLGSLLIVLFCTRKNGWGWDNFKAEANLGKGFNISDSIRWYVSYIVPLIVVVIYLKGYYDMFSPFGLKTLAGFGMVAVILLICVFLAAFTTRKNDK